MSMGQSHLFLIENLTRIHLGFQTHVILLTSLISVAKFDKEGGGAGRPLAPQYLADQGGGGGRFFLQFTTQTVILPD